MDLTGSRLSAQHNRQPDRLARKLAKRVQQVAIAELDRHPVRAVQQAFAGDDALSDEGYEAMNPPIMAHVPE